MVFSELSKLHFGVHLLATYGNGRIEQWFDAKTLDPDDMADPEISRQIARKMCELHALRLDIPEADVIPNASMLFVNLRKWLRIVKEIR